jgi:RimJ/RimL family protein N-acetyltransferase
MSDDEFCELILDLSTVDPAAFDPAVRQQEARGVAFATLAEEQVREPAWLALFCDLENETRRGIDAPRSVEQMVERLAFLKVVPEALFVAKRDGRYIGYTCLNVAESDRSRLIQGWTGVRPEERRQGVATALKVLAIAYTKGRGYERIVTSPRVTNIASIRTNEAIGFRRAPAA